MIVIQVQTHDRDPRVGLDRVVKLAQRRRIGDARAAPGGPEVEHDITAAAAAERDGAAGECGRGKVGHDVSNAWADGNGDGDLSQVEAGCPHCLFGDLKPS